MINRIIPILIVIFIFLSFVCINVLAYSFVYNNVTYYSKGYTLTYNADNTSFIDISSYGLKAYLAGSTSDNLYYSINCNYISVSHANTGNRGIYVTFSSTGSTTNNMRDQFQIKFIVSSGQAIIPSNVCTIIIDCIKYKSNSISIVFNNGGTANNPNTKLYNSDTHKGIFFNKDFSFSNSNFGISLFSDGYTLTFNSNGGSPIAPITDIEQNSTINLVGQFGEYLPQFVPEKEFYDFSGWSLTENGTNVSSVTVTQDTTLYANWVADARNTMIIYDSANGWMNFYGDQNHSTSPPTLVISGNNVSINVYYEITSQVPNGYYLSYFNIEENGTTYRIYPDALYINIIVDTPGYIQITPVFTQLKTLTVTYNPTGSMQDNTMQFGVLEHAYRGGTSVTLTGSYSYPMFITKIRLVGNTTHRIYEIDIQDSWDEQENNFYFEMYFTMPDEDSTITVFWSVMGGVAPLPVVSYDESGNAYFMGVSEENLFSQDFSGARDLIPKDFVGIVEYFGALQGLSIVVTIILVAGFAAFLLRRA